ncbi:MAG TPA: hypothetical protein VMT62_17410, partial [Syntrophorhabdaceae bacterium]|nr:hypothetical protein [Syntrophorhabdaceae bacterium]
CELYTMLTVHRALQGVYPLGGHPGRRNTTLIHKEWPETRARPGKQGRRGNFDLVILDPEKIPRHTVKEFCGGRIKPTFVVEMGLNYKLKHLQNDDTKLTNSRCQHGYLVHLWQPHRGMPPVDVGLLQDWCSGKFHIAAAVFTRAGTMVKHLNDPALNLQAQETPDSQQPPAK